MIGYHHETLTNDGALTISFKQFLLLIFHTFSEDELQKKAVDVASQQQAAPGEATHAADVDPGKSAEMVEDQEEEQPFDEDAEIEDVE